jgi:hypothetical protein
VSGENVKNYIKKEKIEEQEQAEYRSLRKITVLSENIQTDPNISNKKSFYKKIRQILCTFEGCKINNKTKSEIVHSLIQCFMFYQSVGLFNDIPNVELIQDESNPSNIIICHKINNQLIGLEDWISNNILK